MATYTKEQIENVWFALNLNRLIPNNEAYSGAGLHNPNRSINMYKWLQDALTLIGVGPITLPLNTKGDILTYTNTLAKLGVGSNGQVLTADSSTATGLKWVTPSTPPSYTPPVTTKGDIFTFDTVPNKLPLGTNNQILSVDTSTATGLKWITPTGGYTSPLTTKGDIFVRSASDTRLPVGTNGQFLSADSSEATGLKWVAAPGGGGGTNIYNSNGTLTGNRAMDLAHYTLQINDTNKSIGGATGDMGQLLSTEIINLYLNKHESSGSGYDHTATMYLTQIPSSLSRITSVCSTEDPINGMVYSEVTAQTTSTGTSAAFLSVTPKSSNARTIGISTELSLANSDQFYLYIDAPTYVSGGSYSINPKRYNTLSAVVDPSYPTSLRYTYPLERRDFYFADSMQGTTVLNAYSKTGLTTDSDGASRRIVKVTMSCTANAGTSGADSIEITLYRHDNSVIYTALITTPPVSAGKIFEADLFSAPISLSANSTYYARVTTLNGVSSATKGLTLTVYTI